jgi:anti-sigma regulatory factor (Ser/Thr protein kinase)
VVDRCESLHLQLPARPPSIARLRSEVVAYAAECGASPRQCEDIAVGVCEALTNAVLHAYVDSDLVGAVWLSARAAERSLEVVVSDAGYGMRPRADSPGLGLGLSIIATLTKTLSVEDARPGVRLRMTFTID